MTATLENRIATLEPKLRALALSIAQDAYLADDLYQNAMVRIFATCTPDLEDGIIYLRAKSAMLHTVRAESTYNRYVADERQLCPTAIEDDDLVWELWPSHDQPTPEDEVIQREELAAIKAAIASLSPENRQVVQMMASGKNQAEIARDLGVSRAAISTRMNRIASKLQLAGLTPAFAL